MSKSIKIVVADQKPVVVLIGEVSKLTIALQRTLENKGVSVEQIPFTSAIDFLQNFKNDPYKVVVVHTSQQKASTEVKETLEFLSDQQYNVTLIAPMITPIKKTKEITISLLKPWSTISIQQKEFVVTCNDVLPDASYIFLTDIIDLVQVTSPLDFITNQISDSLLFDPDITLYPQVVMSALSEIIDILLRPHKTKSYLIKGDAVSSRSIVVQVKKEVLAYYQIECDVEKISAEADKITPFSSTTSIVSGNHVFAIKEYSRSLSLEKKSVEYVFSREENNISPSKRTYTENISYQEDSYIDESNTVLANQVDTDAQSEPEVVDVSKELQRIFDVKRTHTKLERVKNINSTSKHIKKKSTNRKILFAGGIGSMLLGVFVIGLSILFWYSQRSLTNSIKKATSVSVLTNAVSDSELSNLEDQTDFLERQKNAYSSIFDENVFTDADIALAVGEDLQYINKDKQNYRDSIYAWVMAFRGNNSSSSDISPIITSAEAYFSRLQSLADGINSFGYQSEDLDETASSSYIAELDSLKDIIFSLSQFESMLPELLGMNSRKTYAVLLQNNQELRPTGGFIQAVAILKFDKGSLIASDVYSSYQIDQQLAGVVEPPEEIKRYLDEERWFMRDSNWDPHFPATASRVKWFLDKSIGVQIDGVLAIDLDGMADLIEASEPIELSDYNEVVTHANLFERMEFHSEVVLVETPESKDYSTELFSAFLQNLQKVPADRFANFAHALKESFDEKKIVFSVFNSDQSVLFSQLGWDGSIMTPPCPGELSSFPCVVETVGQFEANVGVNKANYYIDSAIDHTIKIEPKMVYHTRRMTYKNTAESNAWPKGSYRSYQRLYLPSNAQVTSVVVNTRQLPQEQLKERILNDKKVIGYTFEVPIQSTTSVEVSFQTPVSETSPFSYAFFNQKQLGVSETPISTTIVPHPGLHPSLIAPQAKLVSNSILFEQRKDIHSLYAVTFE